MALTVALWRSHALTGLQGLVLVMAFMAPGKLPPLNVLSGLIVIGWILTFQAATHWEPVRRHPLFWACQGYFWLAVFGLLWTEDLRNGLEMIDHALPLALLPAALLTVVAPMNRQHILSAFLLGLTGTAILAHYNWLQLHFLPHWPLSPLNHPDPVDTAPFTGWVAYAPMLALGCYLAARRAKHQVGLWRWLYAAVFLLLLNNLVFSGGRTGMVAFCALALYGCFRWLRGRLVWPMVAGGLFISLAVGTAYLGGGEYRARFDRGIAELQNPDARINGSVSSRIVMARHTWQMIRFNPVLGIGTGDWPVYYHHLNRIHTPKWRPWREPHNQYLLSWSTLGIGGLVLLVLIYFSPWLRRVPTDDGLDHLRWALPVWMGSISVFGSYLWDSHTCLVFLLFSAIAWSGCEGSQQRLQRRP